MRELNTAQAGGFLSAKIKNARTSTKSYPSWLSNFQIYFFFFAAGFFAAGFIAHDLVEQPHDFFATGFFAVDFLAGAFFAVAIDQSP